MVLASTLCVKDACLLRTDNSIPRHGRVGRGREGSHLEREQNKRRNPDTYCAMRWQMVKNNLRIKSHFLDRHVVRARMT